MSSKAQIFQSLLSGLRFNGAVASGYKVYFYSPGTTDLLEIYLDRNKQSQAANPYTLSSNGRAELFGDGVYDVVFRLPESGPTDTPVDTWESVSLVDVSVAAVISSDIYASLNAAIIAIGSTKTRLVVNAALPLTGNATVPSTLELDITSAGSLTLSGYTLAINSPFMPGRYQVFTGSGVVSGLAYVNPVWFPDTQAGNQMAFSAVTAGGVLELTSTRTVTGITAPVAMMIKGTGGLTQAIGDVGNSVLILSADNTTVDGITITGPVTTGNANFGDYAGIDFQDRSNIVIKNCTITGKQNGLQAVGTAATPVSNISLLNNTIRYTGKGIMVYPSEGTGVLTDNFGKKVRVIGNDVRLQEGYSTVYSGSTSTGELIRGIAIHHFNDVVVEGNTSLGSILSCEVAQFVNDDFMTGIKVVNNTFDTWASVNGCDGGVISGNLIDYSLLPTIHTQSDYYGIAYGAGKASNAGLELVYSKNLTVGRNVIVGQPGNGIFIGYAGTHPGSIAQTATNLTIDGNTIKQCGLGSSSMAGLQMGLIRDSTISNNIISGCGAPMGGLAINAGGEVGISANLNNPISNIYFLNNTLRNNLNTTSTFRLFGFKNVTVSGLVSEGNAGIGLSVGESQAFGFTLRNSNIRNNGKFGLYFKSGNVREALIENNDLSGNGASDVTKTGITLDGTNASTALSTYAILRNNKGPVGAIADATVPTEVITFMPGDIWPTTHATNKWMRCTGQGTAGTLFAIGTVATISTINGSVAATTNARGAMELIAGQLLTIAGVTGVKRINSIVPTYDTNGITLTGATIGLSTAADATVTNGAVTYSAPTVAVTT